MTITSSKTIPSIINFVPRDHGLVGDLETYTEDWNPGFLLPVKPYDVPLTDIREDLDNDVSVADQIHSRGWAVARNHSLHVDQISTPEGIEAYLAECRQIIMEKLGCTHVITWNSTVRKADNRTYVIVPTQDEPERDFIPTDRVQPPAGFAHVDQDAIRGRVVVGHATGKDVSELNRSMIVNIWRPLHGPVTNSPLAMVDFNTLGAKDALRVADNFGTAFRLHYSVGQKWSYIRHQQPDEIIFLMCYDSDQGKDGHALFAGHTAVDVGDWDKLEGKDHQPRESIEVRLIAVWQ